MPFAVAPREQTHVPLILWQAEGSAGGRGPQAQCLGQRLDKPLSHDHLFHTVLGIAGVQTQLYQPGLDLIAPCRPSKNTSPDQRLSVRPPGGSLPAL